MNLNNGAQATTRAASRARQEKSAQAGTRAARCARQEKSAQAGTRAARCARQEKSAQAGTRAARCAREGRRAFLTFALAAFAIPHVRAAQESDHHSGADHADQPDEPVFDLGDGITPPKVIHQVIPKPDSGEQGFRISGVVLIGLVVSSRGLPVNVHVVHSVDKDVDQNALDAVREWRFEPARKGDKPVAVRLTIEIRFHDV